MKICAQVICSYIRIFLTSIAPHDNGSSLCFTLHHHDEEWIQFSPQGYHVFLPYSRFPRWLGLPRPEQTNIRDFGRFAHRTTTTPTRHQGSCHPWANVVLGDFKIWTREKACRGKTAACHYWSLKISQLVERYDFFSNAAVGSTSVLLVSSNPMASPYLGQCRLDSGLEVSPQSTESLQSWFKLTIAQYCFKVLN